MAQSCWDASNLKFGSFLHSPLMDELKAVEEQLNSQVHTLPLTIPSYNALSHQAVRQALSAWHLSRRLQWHIRGRMCAGAPEASKAGSAASAAACSGIRA